jgi:site-specific recombinase
MFRSLKTFVKKWRASRNSGHQLDALLAIADQNAPYADRSEWLIEVAHWIHRDGSVQPVVPSVTQDPTEDNVRRVREHARLRYLLHVLDRNPAWKANVAGILRALLR